MLDFYFWKHIMIGVFSILGGNLLWSLITAVIAQMR